MSQRKKTSIVPVPSNETTDKLSLKLFFMFSWVMYPVWITTIAFYSKYAHVLSTKGYETAYEIFMLIFYIVLNWIFGQKRFRWHLVLIPNALMLPFFYEWLFPDITWATIFHNPLSVLSILSVLVVYGGLFFVVWFIQFAFWIPFLVKFTIVNRHSLSDIKWDE